MKTTFAWIVALALAALSLDAGAQGFPRRDRGGSPRDEARRDKDTQKVAPITVADPFASLERELPSLKNDLRLTAEQSEAWNLFERDVRDAAEMDRMRRRHLMSLWEGGEKAPNALTVIGTLAEEDRVKSEATTDLKRHLEALYARLDESQRRLVDRRVVLSQTDPMGR